MKTSQPSVSIIAHHQMIISIRSPGAGAYLASGKARFLKGKPTQRAPCERKIVIDGLSERRALAAMATPLLVRINKDH